MLTLIEACRKQCYEPTKDHTWHIWIRFPTPSENDTLVPLARQQCYDPRNRTLTTMLFPSLNRKYWYILPNTFIKGVTKWDSGKEKWINLHKGSIAIRDETPIKKNYLKGWVVCQDGVERYCLAPIPGSYEWRALIETNETVRLRVVRLFQETGCTKRW